MGEVRSEDPYLFYQGEGSRHSQLELYRFLQNSKHRLASSELFVVDMGRALLRRPSAPADQSTSADWQSYSGDANLRY
jgi:hypothetical protein